MEIASSPTNRQNATDVLFGGRFVFSLLSDHVAPEGREGGWGVVFVT